jgi:hypothetical protein
MLRVLEAHFGSRQVSRVIYGAIIGLALVVALQDHPPSAGVVAATLAVTAVAVSLAELYSDFIGGELRTHKLGMERREFRRVAEQVGAIALGTAFPAVFFILAAAGAMETHTAFVIARWSGLGLITFYGFAAARLAGAGLIASLVHAAAVGGIAAILIVVKALVH